MKTSTDPRHQTRRLAVAVIYSVENTTNHPYNNVNETLINTICETLEIESYDVKMYKAIIDGVKEHYSDLKELINLNSTDWDIEKIYKPDISILLVAAWEVKYGSTPHKVIIDEAVELAKEFGDKESPKFINGVLAGIVK